MGRSKDSVAKAEGPKGTSVFFSLLVGLIALVGSVLTFRHTDASFSHCLLVGINVAGLLSMGFDKSVSFGAARRIPEVVFFVLALLGGSPGLILGSHIFKHKTRKAAFQFVLLIIIAAQFALARTLGLIGGSE